MSRIISPNLLHLTKSLREGYSGAILEGSSRSTKTWASVDFVALIAGLEKTATIKIIKETYNSFKTTLYEDFNRRFPMLGLRSPFQNRQDVSTI